MSEENVKLTNDAIAAYNSGGMEAVLGYFDPNVELVAPPQWPEDRVLRGHAGLGKIQAGWDEQFDDLRLDPERIIDAGENGVLALYTLRIGVKGTDRELVQPAGLYLEFLNGKCTRWHAFRSWEEALADLGLEQ